MKFKKKRNFGLFWPPNNDYVMTYSGTVIFLNNFVGANWFIVSLWGPFKMDIVANFSKALRVGARLRHNHADPTHREMLANPLTKP